MDNCPSSPVYAVIFTENVVKSPREVFHSLKEASKFANSPEGKAHGARFKKFTTTEEANSFLSSGDCGLSPLSASSSRNVANEPTIPSPSLKITELTALKKTIEKDDVVRFCELVESNPRYLINTNADTPSILMEGMRYNALHIATRGDKPLIVSKILSYLNDVNYIMKCFGTSEDDAYFRMRKIVDMIINNADKGQWETPLHMASKLGHVDVVKALLAEPLINKELLNKEGRTALDIVCSRCEKADKAIRKRKIELLLNGFYVTLYRASDSSGSTKLSVLENIPEKTLRVSSNHSPLQSEFVLAAYAGPFNSRSDAEEFLNKWNNAGKDIKCSDVDKGYERVGRELKISIFPAVEWRESWFFLNNSQVLSFTTSTDLAILNNYLRNLRSGPITSDPIRKKLIFDEDEDEDDDITDDEFEDAVDEIPLNDTIGSLAGAMNGLSLDSPRVIPTRRESSEDYDEYATPPSTPPPVYIMGLPTKSDIDLYTALSIVPEEILLPFTHIRFFIRKIGQTCQKTKPDWPAKDSPRVCRTLTPRRYQNM